LAVEVGMISLPLSYREGAKSLTMYRYYANFLTYIAEQNHLKGMYGLTGEMLNEALKEYGAVLGDNDLIFENEKDSTMFMLRWS
jgi:hypothetical protein